MTEDQRHLAIECIGKSLVVAGMLVSTQRSRALVSITLNASLTERAAQLIFEHMVEMSRWGLTTPRIMRQLMDRLARLADES